MKLITYRFRGAEHVGALTGDGAHVAPLPFQDMNQLIAASSLPHLRTMAAQAEEAGAVIPTAQITLLAVSYTHLKLLTAVIVAIFLAVPYLKSKHSRPKLTVVNKGGADHA